MANKKKFQAILNQKLDRKNFLKQMGLGAIAVMGASSIVNLLSKDDTAKAATTTFQDSDLLITDDIDTTKVFRFDVSAVSTGTTRVLTVPNANTTLVGTDTAQTLSNKKINRRVTTLGSSATPTINTDNTDTVVISGLSTNITSMSTNLSGTPTDGQLLWVAIDGASATSITWGSSFESSSVALPTVLPGTGGGGGGGSAPIMASVGTKLAGAGGATANIPVPSGVSSGDIILVYLYTDPDTLTITGVPTGFTEAPNSPSTSSVSGGTFKLHVYWKRATAADSGTYNFTLASGWRQGIALRYTGCASSGNPIDVATAAAATAGTASPATSVTTTGSNRLLVWAGVSWDGHTCTTPPSGFTANATGVNDNSESGFWIGSKSQATAGSTGTLNATWGGTGTKGVWLGALSPSGGTTSTSRLDIGLVWNASTSKWRCVCVA